MCWPESDAAAQVAQAQALGFPDLYYYGVDEPHGEHIARCRNEAERRVKAGLHMMTAMNNLEAQAALKDVVDRPILNLYVFGGRDNPVVQDLLGRGFVPVSYWSTAVSFPLWYRALAGLYNTACGYRGTAPWAYQDFPDNRLYDGGPTAVHAVAYPDAFGEPIPTLRWEAFRDGIDDVRYLQALDRAIELAEARLKREPRPAGLAEALVEAREVRKTRFETISGRWFEYICALTPETLDATRRDLADAIARLQAATRP
jgi:hypothetical protein